MRLQPDPDKSVGSKKSAIGHIASSNTLKFESWTNEADGHLYVRKAT